MKNELEPLTTILLTATTGKASFNINGITIHSLPNLPVGARGNTGWIDKRCRQATGQQDEVFGNVSIILIGDPAQLPPVADKPLYHSKPSGVI